LTVNDKKEIDRLKALGVDGIISDYPNLFNE
jgi:glycerophosphoryl diester phosphodiesterase